MKKNKRQLTLFLFIVSFNLNLNALANKDFETLNLKERVINGSIIEKSKNKIIIPNAKKLGISNELRIKSITKEKEDENNKNNNEEYTVLYGHLNEKGDLVVDLNNIGITNLLSDSEYILGTKNGRKKFASKFSYNAPKIIKGSLEIPISNDLTNESNAIITVNRFPNHTHIKEIKPILVKVNKIFDGEKEKKIKKYKCDFFIEVPGSILKNEKQLEVKAQINTPTKNGIKNITLGTLTEIKKSNKPICKIDISSTVALNIINATIKQIKEVIGEDAIIPPASKSFNEVSSLFIKTNESLTVDDAIEHVKDEINNNSQNLFASLYNFVNNSPSVQNSQTASNITINIAFNTSLQTKDNEVLNASNEEMFNLNDFINTLKNSPKENKTIEELIIKRTNKENLAKI